MKDFAVLLVAVALAAGSNLIVKSRSTALAHGDSASAYVLRMALDPWIWLGALAFAAATVMWILALRRLELSVAQPIMALVFVIVPIASHFLLNESLPPLRIAGLVLITSGVFLVTRSI